MAGYGIVEQSNKGGLMQFTTNEELDRRDRDAAQKNSDIMQSKPEVVGLAGHIRSAFTMAITAKQQIQEEMLKSLRQRNGIYEADILQGIIKQGGTKIYMMITDVKCRALESYLKDIMLPVGEKPFELEATPIPEIRPEVAKAAWIELGKEVQAKLVDELMAQGAQLTEQQFVQVFQQKLMEEGPKLKEELLKQIKEIADDAAKELGKQINDDFTEGGWYEAMSEFIDDLSTYPTAFMVGPIYRKEKAFEWVPIPNSGLSEMKVVDKIVKRYERFDPFDVYPSPGSKNIQTDELCLRLRLQRKDLLAMKGVKGFNDDSIDQVLSLYGKSGFRDMIYSDTEHADLHDRPQETQDPTGWIDGVKYFGSVQGLLLRQWGMGRDEVPDPFDDYSITAIVIGRYVIMARINHHPLKKRGIYSASFKKKNGTIWGEAPPYLMRDIQDFCNSAARSICNNFAIASGPQIWINTERVPAGVDVQDIFPWKIWAFTNPKANASGSTDKPMDFFQPQVITGDLMKAYDYFFKQASEITGIPAYNSENLRGAGKTARGLAMLRNDAARGIRAVARNIDSGVVSPSVTEHWISIMLEQPDKRRGDVKVVARASEYLVQQEQLEMRRNEFLNMTNNPTDLEIVGIGGRAELLKENVKALKIDSSKIVPEKEDMIRNIVQGQINQIIMTLAQALGMAPEELMAILQPVQAGGGQRQIAPKNTDGTKMSPDEKSMPA